MTTRANNTGRWMLAAGVAFVVLAVSLFLTPAQTPDPEPQPAAQSWPQVTRCSVVMPEDLDRVDGN